MNINKAKVIAREAGLKRYFTGKPCVHGHVCERLVSGGQCVECMKAPTYRKRMALNMKRLRRRVGNTKNDEKQAAKQIVNYGECQRLRARLLRYANCAAVRREAAR
jgi:hypothetical protein